MTVECSRVGCSSLVVWLSVVQPDDAVMSRGLSVLVDFPQGKLGLYLCFLDLSWDSLGF